MKTIVLYLTVALVAGGAAWLVLGGRSSERSDPRDGTGSSAGLEGLQDPLWYRDLAPPERLGSARFRLLRMTSSEVSPQQIGSLKDEIALLCHDEAVVDLIVSAFEELPRRAPARTSAFMEIFARVRHPKFESLYLRAVNHEDYEPQANALEAARVQASERALPVLGAALAVADPANQVRVVRALQAIDSAAGYDLIRRHLGRLGRDALVLGLPLLAESNYREARPAIEKLLDHPEIDVQIIAAYAAARLGRSDAVDRLEAHARATERLSGSRAQALQLHARVAPPARATRLDLELLEDRDELVRAEALSGLVARREAQGLERARTDLASSDVTARSRALIALGRSGRDEDLAAARAVLDRIGPRELQVFLTSVGLGRAPAAVELLTDVVRRGGPDARIALGAFPDHGRRALPALEGLLAEARDEELIADLARAIAAIPCDRARDILLAWRPRGSARLRLYVRSGVRRIDQKLLAGEVAGEDRGLR